MLGKAKNWPTPSQSFFSNHILYFWLQLSHNLTADGLKDIPTRKQKENLTKSIQTKVKDFKMAKTWHFVLGLNWQPGKFCRNIALFLDIFKLLGLMVTCIHFLGIMHSKRKKLADSVFMH